MAIIGRRRRRGRHWTLATAPRVRHSCCKMPFSADAAGLAQPTIAAGSRAGAALTKRGCAGVQTTEPRCASTCPSAQPAPAPVPIFIKQIERVFKEYPEGKEPGGRCVRHKDAHVLSQLLSLTNVDTNEHTLAARTYI